VSCSWDFSSSGRSNPAACYLSVEAGCSWAFAGSRIESTEARKRVERTTMREIIGSIFILLISDAVSPRSLKYGGKARRRSFTPTKARMRMSAGFRKRNFAIRAAKQK